MDDQSIQGSAVSSSVGTTSVPHHIHNGADAPLLNVNGIIGQHAMVTGMPTGTPANYGSSIALDSTMGRIWYYDSTNKVWIAAWSSINTPQNYTSTPGGQVNLDLSKGNLHFITMPAGNITIGLLNGAVGQCFIVRILQDGIGSRTVTWFTTIKWAGGGAPTLTTTGSKADEIGFVTTGAGTYDGVVVGLNF